VAAAQSVDVVAKVLHLSLQQPARTACERGERCQGAVLSIREKGLATSGTGCCSKVVCNVAAFPLLRGLLCNGGSRARGAGASSSLGALSDTQIGCQDIISREWRFCVSAAATPGTKGEGNPYALTAQSNSNESPADRALVRWCGPCTCKAGLANGPHITEGLRVCQDQHPPR
jgi:hypothetical protein